MKICLTLLVFYCMPFLTHAQDNTRYANDVASIKLYEKIYAPPKEPIVFSGSSSIRLWGGLEQAFPGHVVLNRGIGGAIISDIAHYTDELIVSYNPRQVVLYIGENELPDEKATSDSIANRTKRLLTQIRTKLPKVPVLYISMKPSPSREQYFDKMTQANRLIREYISAQKDIRYIDVCKPMLTSAGKPKPELFREDRLHMNALGYAIWIKAIKPYLVK